MQPLQDCGLLSVLDPQEWIDQEMTEQLSAVCMGLLADGAFDGLPETTYFAELSQSRLGYSADIRLADMLVQELLSRDLARPSEDGVSIPLHPVVRTTILVLLAQLARMVGTRRGLRIHPATNNAQAVGDLLTLLSREPLPSAAHVISLDLEPVSLDLDLVPLNDVLDFRASRLDAHKAYMRDLQRVIGELSAIESPDEREALLTDRREELADAARELQRSTRRAFGKNLASWSLGLAGGAWAATSGDPIGLALSGAGLLPQLVPSSDSVSAYSYLFAVRDEFRPRA